MSKMTYGREISLSEAEDLMRGGRYVAHENGRLYARDGGLLERIPNRSQETVRAIPPGKLFCRFPGE